MQYLIDRHGDKINAGLMIRITNAMYGCPAEAPSQDEMRDMFSSGQLTSKFWMLDRLERVNERIERPIKTALVVGGWYGILAYLLHEQFLESKVFNLDIDPRCTTFARWAFHDLPKIQPVLADMYEYDYARAEFDLVVNTSCEHIPDVRAWLDKLPKGQLVALQTNNFKSHPDHISCVDSLQEFRDIIQLSSTEEVGEIKFPMYTRYMVIGRT